MTDDFWLCTVEFLPSDDLEDRLFAEPLNFYYSEFLAETRDTSTPAMPRSGSHVGCTALRITLRFSSRYREFPTT
jgi:hypothetical protein